jgi:hypothetical protein
MNIRNFAFISIFTGLTINFGCKSHITHNSPSAFGGSFPDKPGVVKHQMTQTEPSTIDPTVRFEPNNVDVAKPTIATPKKQKITLKKALVFKKALRNAPLVDSTDTDQILEPIKPIEKNALIGFWLVIGSLLAGWIPIVGLFSGFAMIAGFILGIIGLINIKKAPDSYRGKGKAIAAILIPSILFFIVILAIVALVASGFFLI